MTLLEKRLELVGLQNPFAGVVPRAEVGDQGKSTVGPRLEFEGWFVDCDPKRNVRLAARPAFAPRTGAFALAVLLLIGAHMKTLASQSYLVDNMPSMKPS